jgi:hypothetical protein
MFNVKWDGVQTCCDMPLNFNIIIVVWLDMNFETLIILIFQFLCISN